MLTTRSRPRRQTPTGYADTHCRQCEAGWTRTGKEGGVLTVCLLDREPVLADMTHCDRYEQKPANPV
jgi:hypothetical protein